MEALGPILLMLAVGGFIIALTILTRRQQEKRRNELTLWAQSKGFSFSPDFDRGMDQRFEAFEIFQQGKDRRAYNVSSGTVAQGSRSVMAFDYHYATESVGTKGKRTTEHHEISVVVISTQLRLKSLSIRTENLFDRIGEFFGMDDIDFELAEFNRAFHVRAPERRWAFDVLHQKAMEFMLASPRFVIEFKDGRVLAYLNNRFSSVDFDNALALLNGLLDILPASVVRELSDSR